MIYARTCLQRSLLAGSIPNRSPRGIKTITTVRTHATAQVTYPQTRLEFKSSIKSGKKSIGLFLNASSPTIADAIAAAHLYDWLLVDCQHSPVNLNLLHHMLASISTHSCPSLVRVGGPYDRIGIQQALDAGAYGIMVPTIKTVDDAKAAVDAAFFPPLGSRSFAAPIPPQHGRSVADFLHTANAETLLIVQIETKEAYENLKEILSVPGIDATFVGPFDLSCALGIFEKHGFPRGLASQDLRQACRRIAAECKEVGVVPGSFASDAQGAATWAKEGFTLLSAATDVGLVLGEAERHAQAMRTLTSSTQ